MVEIALPNQLLFNHGGTGHIGIALAYRLECQEFKAHPGQGLVGSVLV